MYIFWVIWLSLRLYLCLCYCLESILISYKYYFWVNHQICISVELFSISINCFYILTLFSINWKCMVQYKLQTDFWLIWFNERYFYKFKSNQSFQKSQFNPPLLANYFFHYLQIRHDIQSESAFVSCRPIFVLNILNKESAKPLMLKSVIHTTNVMIIDFIPHK